MSRFGEVPVFTMLQTIDGGMRCEQTILWKKKCTALERWHCTHARAHLLLVWG